MSKTKNRERSELEHLRGQIRELESENRQLRKRLKQLDKKAHMFEDLIEAVAEEIEVKDVCPKCKEGVFSLVDLKYSKFKVCSNKECQNRVKL